ncbi:hypothetical protein D9Q98_002628 [Chlorella vulgaris]|uniref:Dynein heavy chain n=1 Tax=Chlorella vulgaris TaxID=3077 RepID=A0A9D4TTW1_CHLVU|nr:hypothetical protein D9Q98_002628 [Chlorella vulgaris]
MDFRTMGQIFKGLAQTGSWACLDEFNRIPVPVLSVSSTQYKSLLDALRAQKQHFVFEEADIAIKSSAMMFITMNPGYPGRAELPESVKALFRPVSMAIPDLALICEIMLMAEGFQQSKVLSRKFVILYKLCDDLLSKSRHYDWKLRAIKTTLYVAGIMKRAAPELSEEKVLLRALRDFNLGKLTADDTVIFMGLLCDLFPKMNETVPRGVDASFECKVQEAAVALGYQPEPTFCLRVSQLREIFEVRWSVFLLGPAGCGKSAIWRTLMKAQNIYGERTVFRAINPKAVTRNELYGCLHPQTREWKEGLMSSTFRDMAHNKTNLYQWVVLDGDIDAEWIESANTVMDDNKVLTLASNERIPLTSSMRLLLEINNMNHCSPATVSRGGVIFVNVDDIGWKPAVESWVDKLECVDYKPLLGMLFSKYVDATLEYCRRHLRNLVPLPAINQVQTLCKILEGVLPTPTQRGASIDKKLLELHFVFACIWAFGGCLLADKVSDCRQQFSRWWQLEHKTVVFPTEGSVFDYFVDENNVCMSHWRNRVPKLSLATDSVFVPTIETARLKYLLDLLSAIELVRQSIDYHGWFDKQKTSQKEVTNTQYLACMNPTAGSSFISPRLQRHFVTIAVQMPSDDTIRSMFLQILEHKLRDGFNEEVFRLGSRLVDAMMDLNIAMMEMVPPSTVKFHYQYNLRELSRICEGWCRASSQLVGTSLEAVRLWLHECQRVLGDRLVDNSDLINFKKCCSIVLRKHFSDIPLADIQAEPLLFTSFMTRNANDLSLYAQALSADSVKAFLQEKLSEYNDSHVVMDLELFPQAVDHVSRIARIVSVPNGHAMLMGVGGSGKQSLARLAAYVCGLEVFQISSSAPYDSSEFKLDLLRLYYKAGVTGTPVMFLLTDNQIVNDEFLVYISDLLATGDACDLCTAEDKAALCNAVRTDVKSLGLMDTQGNCWHFITERIRKNLHVVLCFSPVGGQLKSCAEQFPALINCMTLDWFHSWPEDALISVARRFLADVPDLPNKLGESIVQHMAFVHQSVGLASQEYYDQFGRYNYTTQKSYLEYISLYKSLLASRRDQLGQAKHRLIMGVDKITSASHAVDKLRTNLHKEQIIVDEKRAKTQELVETIGQEKAKVDDEVEKGREDETAAAQLQAEVTAFQVESATELAVAEPIIQDAVEALQSLDKASLGELKSFGSPAAEIAHVVAACMVLCSSNGIPKDLSWNAGKKFMGNTDAFLRSLLCFDKDSIPVLCVDRVEKDYISSPNFRPEHIRTKSSAAAGLCAWVINICKYHRIYEVVAPKRIALAEANKRLDSATKKLFGIRARVKDLQDRVLVLEAGLQQATEDKNVAIAQAERTANKAALAQRLITGLAGEYARWNTSIQHMSSNEANLVGDVLLSSSFVSYVGAFNTELRNRLVQVDWLKDISDRSIPLSLDVDPVEVLIDESTKAQWASEGLPIDSLSTQNGAIISSSSRVPLLVDPQLQGIKWITKHEESFGLRVVQQGQSKYLDTVIHCIENGVPLLIENCGEEMDPVLDALMKKELTKRGHKRIMKIGDADVEYNDSFRLYLQTRLSNPHYKPEVAAQTTLVNFCVTEAGLEEQLLALVVNHERPDLQEGAIQLVKQLAAYTIDLKQLEDSLLARLAASQGDILEDIPLIENLEETKSTAVHIANQVKHAKETEANISIDREVYRPVAVRGSLLYFLVDSLSMLDRVYQYSMASFVQVMIRGMDRTPGGKDESTVPVERRLGRQLDVAERVPMMISEVSHQIYVYVAQGLFERHKLLVATELCMRVLRKAGNLSEEKFDYILNKPKVVAVKNCLSEWLPDSCWHAAFALKEIDDYHALPEDLVASSTRWREWMELEHPEDEPLPGDWKRLPHFDRLLLFQALRPDRMNAAMSKFVASTLGTEYVTSQMK